MKTKLWNVRGHFQELSSLRATHFTRGRMVRLPLTDGWITVWITEQLCFLSWLPNCHIHFDSPKIYPLFFWCYLTRKRWQTKHKMVLIRLHLIYCYRSLLKITRPKVKFPFWITQYLETRVRLLRVKWRGPRAHFTLPLTEMLEMINYSNYIFCQTKVYNSYSIFLLNSHWF